MTDRHENSDRTTLTGREARQGRIVLNTPGRRIVFVSAFVAIALLGVIGLVVAAASA
jgi:hypothetical protein